MPERRGARRRQFDLRRLGRLPQPLHRRDVVGEIDSAALPRHRSPTDRCCRPVEQAVSDAGLTLSDIDLVILTGGATRMPAVGELVRRLTGDREPYRGLIPEGVVTGAALQAGVLSGAHLGTGEVVTNIASHSTMEKAAALVRSPGR